MQVQEFETRWEYAGTQRICAITRILDPDGAYGRSRSSGPFIHFVVRWQAHKHKPARPIVSNGSREQQWCVEGKEGRQEKEGRKKNTKLETSRRSGKALRTKHKHNLPNLSNKVVHRVPRQRAIRNRAPPPSAVSGRNIRVCVQVVAHGDAVVFPRRRDEPHAELPRRCHACA